MRRRYRRGAVVLPRLDPDVRHPPVNWLGAESLGVVVALLNLIWVPIVAFADIAIPDKILTLPIIGAFIVSLAHFLSMYRARVAIKPGQMMGAMIAAMSVQWTVSRAVAQGPHHRAHRVRAHLQGRPVQDVDRIPGVLGGRDRHPAGDRRRRADRHQQPRQITEIYIFAAVLVLESLPFLSAVAIAHPRAQPHQLLPFWRDSAIRTAELIGLRPVGPGDPPPARRSR